MLSINYIQSLFKQNIKLCNARLWRQCWRRVKNNNRSNQQASNFACAAHFFCTFLCRCFAWLQCETSRNFLVTHFLEEMSYVLSLSPFFHCRSFSPCIGGCLHFSFCHLCYKIFLLFFQLKNVSFVFFLSLALDLCHPFSCWALLSCHLLSLFLCLSLALYTKFVDMTINLSVIL